MFLLLTRAALYRCYATSNSRSICCLYSSLWNYSLLFSLGIPGVTLLHSVFLHVFGIITFLSSFFATYTTPLCSFIFVSTLLGALYQCSTHVFYVLASLHSHSHAILIRGVRVLRDRLSIYLCLCILACKQD